MNVSEEFVLTALEKDETMFNMLPDEFKNDIDFIRKAISKNGNILQYVDKKFYNYSDIVMQALKNNHRAIINISGDDPNYLKYANYAVSIEPGALKYIDSRYRKNKGIVLKALENIDVYDYLSSYIGEEFENDKDIIAYKTLKSMEARARGDVVIPEAYKNDLEFAQKISNICLTLNDERRSFDIISKQFSDDVLKKLEDLRSSKDNGNMENSVSKNTSINEGAIQENNLSKLDYALDITNKKYNVNQIKQAIVTNDSAKITGDYQAREIFESLSKDDIDKEMIKYVYKFVNNQKGMFSESYQFSDKDIQYKPLYDLGRSVYFSVNSGEDLDFILSDEKNYEALTNLFMFRYKNSNYRQQVDNCIDENDPRLVPIENYFNSKQLIGNGSKKI